MRWKYFFLISTFFSFTHTAENFQLITVLYNEKNSEKTTEYLTCLERNINHKLIDSVHIIYDTSKDDQTNKVKITCITERPSYGYCFELANNLYPNSKVILSNADIYFNNTLDYLSDYNLHNKFLALTRWNIKNDNNIEIFKQYENEKYNKLWSETSQDTWIFQTPITIAHAWEIKLGHMQCDSCIAYEAFKSGLNVLNPCLSIQCCHLQLSNIRNYTTSTWPYKNRPWLPVEWIKL